MGDSCQIDHLYKFTFGYKFIHYSRTEKQIQPSVTGLVSWWWRHQQQPIKNKTKVTQCTYAGTTNRLLFAREKAFIQPRLMALSLAQNPPRVYIITMSHRRHHKVRCTRMAMPVRNLFYFSGVSLESLTPCYVAPKNRLTMEEFKFGWLQIKPHFHDSFN